MINLYQLNMFGLNRDSQESNLFFTPVYYLSANVILEDDPVEEIAKYNIKTFVCVYRNGEDINSIPDITIPECVYIWGKKRTILIGF